jgi:hypothetical protein
LSDKIVNLIIFPSVSAAAPTENNLIVKAAPTFIIFDWNVPKSGWIHNFTVSMLVNDTKPIPRAKRSSFKNESNETESLFQPISSSRPPINISNLTPETKYSFMIETALNEAWKTTYIVEEVHTTANNSELPENIIGVKSWFQSFPDRVFTVFLFYDYVSWRYKISHFFDKTFFFNFLRQKHCPHFLNIKMFFRKKWAIFFSEIQKREKIRNRELVSADLKTIFFFPFFQYTSADEYKVAQLAIIAIIIAIIVISICFFVLSGTL